MSHPLLSPTPRETSPRTVAKLQIYNAFRKALSEHLGMHFNDVPRAVVQEHDTPDHPMYETLIARMNEILDKKALWRELPPETRHEIGSHRGGVAASSHMRDKANYAKQVARYFGVGYHDAISNRGMWEAFDATPEHVRAARFAELDRIEAERKRELEQAREQLEIATRRRRRAAAQADRKQRHEAMKKQRRLDHLAEQELIRHRIQRVCEETGIPIPPKFRV